MATVTVNSCSCGNTVLVIVSIQKDFGESCLQKQMQYIGYCCAIDESVPVCYSKERDE